MDDCQPGRGDLTAEQWAQRCDWAHRIWAIDVNHPEWVLTSRCITRARAQGHKAPLIAAFLHPEMYPEFINAVFHEYVCRKLIGETP